MKKLQKEIQEYLEERNWTTKDVSNYAKSISIEAAELLEIFQWNNLNADEIQKDKEKLGQVRSELADVFIYCLDMATILNIDAEEAIQEKMEHNKKKYPVELVKGRGENYYKIKKEYRAKGL
jgi:NTP pyrophosphatase (non-canonical NTP hydrolase)